MKRPMIRIPVLTSLLLFASLLFIDVPGVLQQPAEDCPTAEAAVEVPLMPGPEALTPYPPEAPASPAPLLLWSKNFDAVSYQLEFFTELPEDLSAADISEKHCYFVPAVFTNAYNPAIDEFAADSIGRQAPLYWRVRAMNLAGNPISLFSLPEPLFTSDAQPRINSPLPNAFYNNHNGQVLLYPVYSWIGNHGAVQYEIEVLNELPENPGGTEPSIHRIYATIQANCELYDPEPRLGAEPFYWRVRGLDAEGNSVGVYSAAQPFKVNPADNWQIGILGDSISHGGGHLSYGPADWEYSYSTYLNFPTVNLSQSGDTSQMMLERFDKDVLPFHPHYLLILGGSNSLRGGIPAADVIADLEAIRQKCLQNNIKPILMTLPPINPDNIAIAFNEETAGDWMTQFSLVNAYIRTQVHIDLAAAFDGPDEVLPTKYALDGLHLDVDGKILMGETINAAWPSVSTLAEMQVATVPDH